MFTQGPYALAAVLLQW